MSNELLPLEVVGNFTLEASALMNKDYLYEFVSPTSENCTIQENQNISYPIKWIKIKQLGYRDLRDLSQNILEIQNILFATYLPKERELIYLINGNGTTVDIYLGLRILDDTEDDFLRNKDSSTRSLANYICGIWPGSSIEVLSEYSNPSLPNLRYCYSLTGVPSKNSNGEYAGEGSVDKLLSVVSRKPFSYLVLATPMDYNSIEKLIDTGQDLTGAVESVIQTTYSHVNGSQVSVQLGEGKGKGEFSSQVNSQSKQTNRWITELSGRSHSAQTSINKGTSTQQTKTKTVGLSNNTSNSITYTVVNKKAERLASLLNNHIQRIESGKVRGLWDVGVFLLSDDEVVGKTSSMALKSLISSSKIGVEPIRIQELTSFSKGTGSSFFRSAIFNFCRPLIKLLDINSGEVITNPIEQRDAQLSTILTTEELSSYINFPQRSVPGVSIVNYLPDFSFTLDSPHKDNIIEIGKLLYGKEISNIKINLPANTLNRHILVSGTTGSGKTNTVINILNGFASQNKPFMVIEPAKTEYVDWALAYNETHKESPINILMPGDILEYKGKTINGDLFINPFEVISLPDVQPRILSHIDRVKSVFATAFPMQDILPTIMENLIYAVYDIDRYSSEEQLINWFNPKLPHYREHFPTLQTMKARVDSVIRDLGYDSDTNKNLKGCMHTRLNSLTKGWKGDILNNQEQTTDWKQLFEKPCVINLSGVGDDVDRAFIMSLLLQYLYEYRTAESSAPDFSFNDNQCRHLVVIEEAHRIMTNCANPEMPQYKSGQMISNLLSEIAAYGQGVMIVDQIPVRLIPDAVKNTNLKIIHKLVSSDDISAVGDSIGLTDDQKSMIPTLRVGQALMSGLNLTSDVYLTQINKVK